MRFTDLLEKRRNPDHPSQKLDKNSSGKKLSKLEFLQKYSDKDVYISFQALPKLGFNPSMENGGTPAGVYGYPMIAYKNKIKNAYGGDGLNSIFEYGFMRPFIFAFTTTEPLTNTATYSEEQLDNDIELLTNMLYDHSDDSVESAGINILSEVEKMKSRGADGFGTELTDHPFHYLWAASWYVAYHLYVVDKDNGQIIYSKEFAFKWAKVLLDLGYVGFVDDSNNYMIHEGEKSQLVILKPSIIKVVDLYRSKSTRGSEFEGDIYSTKMKIDNNKDKKLMNKFIHSRKEDRFKILATFGDLPMFKDFWNKLSQTDKNSIFEFMIETGTMSVRAYNQASRHLKESIWDRINEPNVKMWFLTHIKQILSFIDEETWYYALLNSQVFLDFCINHKKEIQQMASDNSWNFLNIVSNVKAMKEKDNENK